MSTKNGFKKYQTLIGVVAVLIVVGFIVSALLKTSADNRSSAYTKPEARVTISPKERSRRPTVTVSPSPTVSQINFYTRTTDNITAQPGVASTVIVGCDAGDIALSSGIESYGGPLNKWRTVRTTPSTSTDMNGMLITVLNEDTIAHDFTVTTRCLKK